MTTFLLDLVAAIWAETLKLKRTLALSLTFIAPVLIVALNFAIYWDQAIKPPDGTDTWVRLTQNNLVFWNLLMIPLFVTLQTALLAGMEHQHTNLKHLFALPISRWSVYIAKQIVAMALIGLSVVVLWLAIMASGLLLRQVKPGIGLEAAVPVGRILGLTMLGFFTSWLVIAFHHWVAMRWPSYVVAIGVGIAATVIGVIVIESDYGLYDPWTLPATLTFQFIKDGVFSYGWASLGLFGGLVGCVLGGLEFTRRDVL